MASGMMGSAASIGSIGTSGVSKPSVCRCLFGRPSAEELATTASEFHRQAELVLDEKIRQYNFDFRSHKPLTGNYRWRKQSDDWMGEKVASVDITPPSSPSNNAAIQTDSRLVPEVGCGEAAVPPAAQTTSVASRLERLPLTEQSSSRKRKTIPDYFPCKKLRSSTPPPSFKDRDAD